MKKAFIPKLVLALCLLGLGAFVVADEQRIDQWLKSDQDTDGKLSEAETSGLMKRFFSRNDTNKDGFLDQSELTDLDKRLKQRDWKPKGEPDSESLTAASDSVHFQADVAYRKGNKMWKLDIAYPTEKSQSLRPGIVIVHGGGWRSGDKGGGQWRSLPIEYAEKGYVAISVNYRLTGEAPFPACVEIAMQRASLLSRYFG